MSLLKAPEAKRDHYLQRAVDEGLSVRQLEAAMDTGVLVEAQDASKTTRPRTKTAGATRSVARLPARRIATTSFNWPMVLY